jgi:hypothetical protein
MITFPSSLPGEMLLDLVQQRQRDIRSELEQARVALPWRPRLAAALREAVRVRLAARQAHGAAVPD